MDHQRGVGLACATRSGFLNPLLCGGGSWSRPMSTPSSWAQASTFGWSESDEIGLSTSRRPSEHPAMLDGSPCAVFLPVKGPPWPTELWPLGFAQCQSPQRGAGEATHGTSDVSAVDFKREPRSLGAEFTEAAQKNAAVARSPFGASNGLLHSGAVVIFTCTFVDNCA